MEIEVTCRYPKVEDPVGLNRAGRAPGPSGELPPIVLPTVIDEYRLSLDQSPFSKKLYLGSARGREPMPPGCFPPIPLPPPPSALGPGTTFRALTWLRDHQNLDGSWGERQKPELTALALLAFSKAEATNESKDFGLTVHMGLQWMLDNGTKYEGKLSMGRVWMPGDARVHALAVQALAEQFRLTKNERYLELLNAAAQMIVKGQSADGGWAEQYQQKAGDLEVSSWQILALKSVHLTGLHISGVDAALDRAMKFLGKLEGADGSYSRNLGLASPPKERETMAAMAVLGRLSWDEDHGTRRKTIGYLLDVAGVIGKNGAGEKTLDYQGKEMDLAAEYFQTQAMFLFGGGAWQKWERTHDRPLMNVQGADGSWPPMAAPGYLNLQSADDLSGSVFRTAMIAMTLPHVVRRVPLPNVVNPPQPDISRPFAL